MDERWNILMRVRDLRARLALNEVIRERRAQVRAQAALEQAWIRQAQFEEQATQVISLLARSYAGGDAVYDVTQAQELLDFAAGARLKAQEAAVPIRRAKLQCERAQEGVDEASDRYRREVGRQEAVTSHWQEKLRIARRRRTERADAARAEERVGGYVAQRLRGMDDYGDEE
jgi:hypothetical protein